MSADTSYWDSIAGKKEFTTPFQKDEFLERIDRFSEILDVGCGYGRILSVLEEEGYRNLYGTDISREMITLAEKNLSHSKLSVMKNSILDFADSSMDCVILFGVLTCIYEDKEQSSLIREIRRVLKGGGRLYVNDFLLNSDSRNTERYEKYSEQLGSYGVFVLPDGGILRHHSEEHIKSLFSEFKVEAFQKTVFKTMNGNTSNGFFLFAEK